MQWHVKRKYREGHAPSHATHTTFPGCSNPGFQKSPTQLGDCRGRELSPEPKHAQQPTAKQWTTHQPHGPAAATSQVPCLGPSSSVQSPADHCQEETPRQARVVMAMAQTGPGMGLGKFLSSVNDQYLFPLSNGSLSLPMQPYLAILFSYAYRACNYYPQPLDGDSTSRSQNLSLLGVGHCDDRITSIISFKLPIALRSTCYYDPCFTDEIHEA